MKEFAKAMIKVGSIFVLPVLVCGWMIWGAIQGVKVWAWNINHRDGFDGDWVFSIPKQEDLHGS
jgi:hypothetical protein